MNWKGLKAKDPAIFKILKGTGSSLPEVFCKKGGLRNFAKFTGKHLCQSLNFAKVLRTPFLTEHFWWLLLKERPFGLNTDVFPGKQKFFSKKVRQLLLF